MAQGVGHQLDELRVELIEAQTGLVFFLVYFNCFVQNVLFPRIFVLDVVLEFHFAQALDHVLMLIFKVALVAGVEQVALGIDENVAVGLFFGQLAKVAGQKDLMLSVVGVEGGGWR